uniref:Uncharacterized protein n=1 Tax=Candidatus Kentrum eta TaxID=2126337 RepID=A0A450UBK7_9GAMM|nr:MAG: hypothetical protein BECKH772A_GA0070896_1001611 [Candidatus Kentron sp. H]VFJ92753.1 MAG: hypothetical protein BECKH772B_GA0070898_100338 [Candidatus Kentron sp. H]VFJ97593.1 MAG: hypothetical protein BECKH772C_GA0070978_1001410 [Candidatus Kentron sp. H]
MGIGNIGPSGFMLGFASLTPTYLGLSGSPAPAWEPIGGAPSPLSLAFPGPRGQEETPIIRPQLILT